jgi:hypothetical protein
MASKAISGKFRLEVPLDASGIKDFKPSQAVKVVAFDQAGRASNAEIVRLDEKGHALATLAFEAHPGAVRVLVGPETASEDELKKLQTLTVNVSASQWKENHLRLSAVVIPSFYWWWWPRWCRDYVIRGRLLCADGSPVPGATVCAYDVDWWWWWVSEEQVGCAVTDANGAFEIDFRRCCGWWWWWWWELRNWRVDPLLAERIVPALQKVPGIRRIPIPDPAPDLKLFQSLLSESSVAPHSAASSALLRQSSQMRASMAHSSAVGSLIDPAALESLRKQLVEKLPPIKELDFLCLWPWCPWWPWWDCDADIIFRATQNCNGQTKVILDENIFQVRLDIPSQLNVNLVANDQACCLVNPCQKPGDCPEGSCTVPFDVCSDTSASIGGNPGASPAAATVGYENPGGAAPGNPAGDRPYAGAITLSGIFGTTAAVDYYEIEYATAPGGPWSAMPPAANGGFGRAYWTLALTQVGVPFNPVTINSPDGPRNVFESRQHYEANNSIGIGWDAINYNVMMVWLTQNNFSDGTYYLRLKGWTRAGYAGDLSDKRILPFCETAKDNYVVITIDNRVEGAGSGHPIDHPCGLGTVHVCTTEPDCNVIAVRIDGTPVAACGKTEASGDQTVEIDLMVNDPDGHLAYYTLSSNYSLNLTIPIIYLGGHIGTLSPGPGPNFNTSWVGPAAQVGPDYGLALAQGATAPKWPGGTVTLSAKVKDIFPETCCYQLQLWAYKRTIVNCYYGFDGHANVSELSFTIIRI